jgi:hypothetical protein
MKFACGSSEQGLNKPPRSSILIYLCSVTITFAYIFQTPAAAEERRYLQMSSTNPSNTPAMSSEEPAVAIDLEHIQEPREEPSILVTFSFDIVDDADTPPYMQLLDAVEQLKHLLALKVFASTATMMFADKEKMVQHLDYRIKYKDGRVSRTMIRKRPDDTKLASGPRGRSLSGSARQGFVWSWVWWCGFILLLGLGGLAGTFLTYRTALTIVKIYGGCDCFCEF